MANHDFKLVYIVTGRSGITTRKCLVVAATLPNLIPLVQQLLTEVTSHEHPKLPDPLGKPAQRVPGLSGEYPHFLQCIRSASVYQLAE